MPPSSSRAPPEPEIRARRTDGSGAGIPDAPHRTSGAPARLRSALGWVLTAGIVGVLVWFGWPSTLGGCTTLTIVSGHSMEPTYHTGDLVVSRCGTPEVGDVVVYVPPGFDDGRIIHRVVGGDERDGLTIQGDNNDFLDPWRIHGEDVLGIARLHVPGVGRVAMLLLDPWAWLSLVVAAVGVLLWPSRPEDPTEDDRGTPAPEPAVAA